MDLTIILRIKDGAVGVTGWGIFFLFIFFCSLGDIARGLTKIHEALKEKK